MRRLERSADEPVRNLDPLLHRHLRIQHRHQHVPQLRLQDVVEELERIGAHRGVRRAHADVGIVQPGLRQQQRHQPENPFELLLHGVPQRLDDRVSLLQLPAQRPEHLIRTVVSGNLRGEQQLDDGRVDVNVGTDGAQLVERGDDAVADRPVRLEETGNQRLLGLRGADPQQHRRQLAAHFDRDFLGPQRVGDRRHHRVAQPRERFGGFIRQLRAAQRQNQDRREALRAPDDVRRGWPAARPRRSRRQ